MKRLTLAIALACVLSGVAHAGEIHSTGGLAAQTSSPSTVTSEIPTAGPATPQASTTVLSIILTLINIVR